MIRVKIAGGNINCARYVAIARVNAGPSVGNVRAHFHADPQLALEAAVRKVHRAKPRCAQCGDNYAYCPDGWKHSQK